MRASLLLLEDETKLEPISVARSRPEVHVGQGRNADPGGLVSTWRTACDKAGLPVGHKAGVCVSHACRRAAATPRRAGGMDESDAMKISGWKTTHVFKRYDLGNVDA